jgi:hypothetical protein
VQHFACKFAEAKSCSAESVVFALERGARLLERVEEFGDGAQVGADGICFERACDVENHLWVGRR